MLWHFYVLCVLKSDCRPLGHVEAISHTLHILSWCQVHPINHTIFKATCEIAQVIIIPPLQLPGGGLCWNHYPIGVFTFNFLAAIFGYMNDSWKQIPPTKKGDRKVTLGIIVSMTMIPFQYEKMVLHNIYFKVKNELAFPFVLVVLYILTCYYYDIDFSIFYRLFFLPQSVL